ncbi:hypothetical protein L210DRAFT_3548090 [Boletus edulis BED1]|uniref:Uncharacterized protein n=1 Tax=Boletus edulis BED1 TaxID=1328754 RepID=A0AAD4GCJ4_BOLED|nr:hypothetical protein L210DRAFT_3548090 [Boletus edulis BED1]
MWLKISSILRYFSHMKPPCGYLSNMWLLCRHYFSTLLSSRTSRWTYFRLVSVAALLPKRSSYLTRLRSPLNDAIASGSAGKELADDFMRLASLIRNASILPVQISMNGCAIRTSKCRKLSPRSASYSVSPVSFFGRALEICGDLSSS